MCPWCCTHLLSLRLDGSTNSLVKRDPEEVCSLSRVMMFQSLSARLQDGIRLLLNPTPALPWADFAACCPRREQYGFATFRLQKYAGLGACLRPGGVWVTKAHGRRAVPTSITVWLKRTSHFRSFQLTIFIADSNVFTIPTIWPSSGVWLPEGYVSRDSYPAPCGALLRCQGRSLFRPLDSSGDTDGSLLS